MYDSKEVKKSSAKVQTIYIELTDRRGSGFILDGTRGTKHEYELDAPTARIIPNTGLRRRKDEDGKILDEFEEIRYIKNQSVISVQEQNIKGIKPNRAALEDKIIVKAGKFTVGREGSFIGLYDYLMDVFYNGNNPYRSEGADDLFKVIDIGKAEEQFNEQAIMEADAIQFIGQLYQKVGDKQYRYNEDKINGLCQLFLIYAETMPGKIQGLMGHARRDPATFLDKAYRFEQTTNTEVSHALELNVVKFEGNTAVYVAKDKVLGNLGTGNFSHTKKIEKLSDLLRTPEYKAAYEEFKIELEAAHEKALTATK